MRTSFCWKCRNAPGGGVTSEVFFFEGGGWFYYQENTDSSGMPCSFIKVKNETYFMPSVLDEHRKPTSRMLDCPSNCIVYLLLNIYLCTGMLEFVRQLAKNML